MEPTYILILESEHCEHVAAITQALRPPSTTLAIGEKGGVMTAIALGEEGGSY